MILTQRQTTYLLKKLNPNILQQINDLDELEEDKLFEILRNNLKLNEFFYFKNLDNSLLGTNIQYYSKKQQQDDPIKHAIHTELLSLNYHANKKPTRKYIKKDSIKPLEIIHKKVVITWD